MGFLILGLIALCGAVFLLIAALVPIGLPILGLIALCGVVFLLIAAPGSYGAPYVGAESTMWVPYFS